MSPLLLLIPGSLVAGGVALAIKHKQSVPPGNQAPIPGGKGTVLIPTSLGPGQTVPPVSVTQLPPAVQAALNTPGAPPVQAFVNTVAMGIAQGDPAFAPNHIAKARNGVIFDPLASNAFGEGALHAGDIQPGNSVTFSVSDAGFAGLGFGGSSIMLAQSPCTDSSCTGIFIDSRVPEGTPVTIPLRSVTGIGSDGN